MDLNDKEKEIILALADNNINISETARQLYRHRETVVYNLKKIQGKTGLCPQNFYDLAALVKMIQDGSGLSGGT